MGNTTHVVYADQLSYHVGIRWEILHVVYADQLFYHVGIRWEILHMWYMLINCPITLVSDGKYYTCGIC